MKNNVIKFHPRSASHSKARSGVYRYSRTFSERLMMFADAFATLSIGCCTLFCMYLAYTML